MDLKKSLKEADVCYVGNDGLLTLPDSMRNKRFALVPTELSLLIMPITPEVKTLLGV